MPLGHSLARTIRRFSANNQSYNSHGLVSSLTWQDRRNGPYRKQPPYGEFGSKQQECNHRCHEGHRPCALATCRQSTS